MWRTQGVRSDFCRHVDEEKDGEIKRIWQGQRVPQRNGEISAGFLLRRELIKERFFYARGQKFTWVSHASQSPSHRNRPASRNIILLLHRQRQRKKSSNNLNSQFPLSFKSICNLHL